MNEALIGALIGLICVINAYLGQKFVLNLMNQKAKKEYINTMQEKIKTKSEIEKLKIEEIKTKKDKTK